MAWTGLLRVVPSATSMILTIRSAAGTTSGVGRSAGKTLAVTDRHLGMEETMTKESAEEIAKKTTEIVKNTSSGGHVGGTYFGQEPDAKTSSTRKDAGNKARSNDGRN